MRPGTARPGAVPPQVGRRQRGSRRPGLVGVAEALGASSTSAGKWDTIARDMRSLPASGLCRHARVRSPTLPIWPPEVSRLLSPRPHRG